MANPKINTSSVIIFLVDEDIHRLLYLLTELFEEAWLDVESSEWEPREASSSWSMAEPREDEDEEAGDEGGKGSDLAL